MPVREVRLSDIPKDPWDFYLQRWTEFLRNSMAMTRTFYRNFDWTKNPKQQFLYDLCSNPPSNRQQHILLMGSVGSGKSIGAHAWALKTLDEYPGATWLGLRNTHDEILTSIHMQIRKFLDKYEVPFESGLQPAYIALPNGSRWAFWSANAVVATNTTDVAKGLGSTEFSGATLEEADSIMQAAVDTVPNRLREPSGVPNRILFYPVNPPSDSHWLMRMFDQQMRDNPEDYHKIHMTMEDNRPWLVDGFIESQYARFAHSPALFRRMILGLPGPEQRGDPIFGDVFSRKFHVYQRDNGDGTKRPSIIDRWTAEKMWTLGPICLCWDFGWNHPALVVFQDRDYGRFDQIVVLGAWLGDRELLKLFARYILGRVYQMLPNAEYLCFCDPAGAQKSNQGVTDETAVDVLESLGLRPKYRKSDVEYGINLVADLLASNYTFGRAGVQPLFLIDDNDFTQDIIDGFEIGYVQDPRGQLEDVVRPLKDGKYDHLMDALRYGTIHRRKARRDQTQGLIRPPRSSYARLHTDPVTKRFYVNDPRMLMEFAEFSGSNEPYYGFGD